MKTKVICICLLVLVFSCKKENDSFIAKYQTICGTWKTLAIYSDSAGIQVIKSTHYDRLVINDNLSYKVYRDSINLVENGSIKIISQTNDNLEIYFETKYPDSWSWAGSMLFVQTNSLKLITLSPDIMILKSFDSSYYRYPEFHFKRSAF